MEVIHVALMDGVHSYVHVYMYMYMYMYTMYASLLFLL